MIVSIKWLHSSNLELSFLFSSANQCFEFYLFNCIIRNILYYYFGVVKSQEFLGKLQKRLNFYVVSWFVMKMIVLYLNTIYKSLTNLYYDIWSNWLFWELFGEFISWFEDPFTFLRKWINMWWDNKRWYPYLQSTVINFQYISPKNWEAL